MRAILILSLFLCGCGEIRLPSLPEAPALPGVTAPAPGVSEGSALDQLRAAKTQADASAAQWQARSETLALQIADERVAAAAAIRARQAAWLGYLAVWTVGVSALLFAACLFLCLWLGGMGGLSMAGMVTFGLLGALAGVFLAFQTALLWLVFGLVCLGLVAAVGMGLAALMRWKRATAAAATLADQVMDRVSGSRLAPFVARIKEEAAASQAAAGVRGMIASARRKPIKPMQAATRD